MAKWWVVGWGTIAPQQYRLAHSAGGAGGAGAGIALSLNASALYLGIGLGGLLGGYVVETAGADRLGLLPFLSYSTDEDSNLRGREELLPRCSPRRPRR
jgi:predicted MFS family arabinose efflux permease